MPDTSSIRLAVSIQHRHWTGIGPYHTPVPRYALHILCRNICNASSKENLPIILLMIIKQSSA